jgi:hypothetical protein
MKKIFCWALAGTLLAGCTNDEVINSADDRSGNSEICFRTATAGSRASETDLASLQSSGYWVKALMPGGGNQYTATNGWQKYTQTSGSTFAPEGIADMTDQQKVAAGLLWPSYVLTFFATNADPSTHTIVMWQGAPAIERFTPATNIADQQDLVYATNKGYRWGYNTVPLTFKHALTQIEIKAKCSAPDYTVKVKGYKIHHVLSAANYNFAAAPDAPTTDGAFDAIGAWTAQQLPSGGVDYLSGMYDDGSELTLGDEAVTLRSEDGCAMMIPYGTYSGYNIDSNINNGKRNQGFYIALLVQVNYKNGSSLYPANATNATSTRIAYTGLPEGYGYIYMPITITWDSNYQGKKVTYVFDLSDGLGYVDPAKPDDVNGNTDPYSAEQKVIGKLMKYSTYAGSWSSAGATQIEVKETKN